MVVLMLALLGCQEVAEISCGEGTRLDGLECVPDNCGPGTIEREGICIAVTEQWVALPFAAGDAQEIAQGFHGSLSHRDDAVYAVDFAAAVGTPIAAARSGTVQRVKEDSDSGCGEPSCASQGNYIWIDHGDGTKAKYIHLQLDGALVEVGDPVCAGEIIGLTGNTGFSTIPHLHFEVDDAFGYSLPVRFFELEDVSDGVPFPGLDLASENQDVGCYTTALDWSWCPPDTFAYAGVMFDDEVPCGAVAVDQSYSFSGVVVAGTHFQTNQWSTVVDDWLRSCVAADGEGRFSVTWTWEDPDHGAHSWLMARAAELDEEATSCVGFHGWDTSVFLNLTLP
jgi:hypothetical protein